MKLKKYGLTALAAASLVALVMGCPKREEPKPVAEEILEDDNTAAAAGATAKKAAPAPKGAYKVIEVANGGNVVGTIKWSGAKPDIKALPVTRNQEACGNEQPFPALSFGAGDGVPNTVVYLDGIAEGKAIAAPAEPPTIDQSGCQYTPHVVALNKGNDIAFKNSDSILHNVHGFWGTESWFNAAQPTKGMVTKKTADRAGVARVVCDAGHTWMLSYVHAFEHPYYAVTGADGSYKIDNVPPGKYTVKVWHEGWTIKGEEAGRPVFSDAVEVTREVEVAEKADVTLDVELSTQLASN